MDLNKIKLKKEVLAYMVDDFTDYAGNVHKITAAAVKDPNYLNSVILGVTICNPVDEYIEIIGANRAAKNALKETKAIVSASFSGIFEQNILGALLTNEINYVKNNISLYIHGYNESKKKYLNKSSVGSDNSNRV